MQKLYLINHLTICDFSNIRNYYRDHFFNPFSDRLCLTNEMQGQQSGHWPAALMTQQISKKRKHDFNSYPIKLILVQKPQS